MNNSLKYFSIILIAAISTFVIVQCTKENFTEPQDPFEFQRLDPNPANIILGEGASALLVKTNEGNIVETETGLRVKGSIYIENKIYGDILLTSGDFEFTDNAGNNSFSGFTGIGLIEFPKEGIFKNLDVTEIIASPMGFKKGSEFDLEAFSWPVNENRYYFYYENPDRFGAGLTNTSFDNINQVAVDPADPFLYINCSFEGSSFGPIDNLGIAFSTQGLIPYKPLVDYYNIPRFNGHLYLSGSVPILKYPVAVAGEFVMRFANEESDADKFFNGQDFYYKMGMNGQLTFEHDLLDWLDVEVVLGQASVYLDIRDDGETRIKWAGLREVPPTTPSDFIYQVVGQDWDFLDYLAVSQQKEKFYGTIGTNLSDWEFGFSTDSWLQIGSYKIDMGGITLELSPIRMYFEGRAVLAGFTRVKLTGEINRNGNFELKGSVSNSFHASKYGLSIGYSLKIEASLKHSDGKVTFKGKAKLDGEACAGEICVGIGTTVSITISSDGEFEVCFSIGIAGVGYDVCLDFDVVTINGQQSYTQTMNYEIIPIEQVPIENRYEPE